LFQSHYGAIATLCLVEGQKSVFRFNPTMVRLRLELQTCLYLIRDACFNPTMVRLRLSQVPPTQSLWVCFNPTMVRLRPASAGGWPMYNHVSIPLWCDCDAAQAIWKLGEIVVSIPLWCDCDRGAGRGPSGPERVSIPLWCDCDRVSASNCC